MEIYRNLNLIERNLYRVITIGSFDGVHIGHAKILKKCVEIAKQKQIKSTLITFDPHPRTVLSKDLNLKFLTSFEEKIEIFETLGIKQLIILNFNKEFANLTAEEFIINIAFDKIGFIKLVIGYDHRFGKDRKGDDNLLKELGKKYGFEVEKIESISIENEIVSSTKIRKHLCNGEIVLSNKMLGREYMLEAKVIRGAGRGRIIGYPTANLAPLYKEKLMPANGVYAIRIKINSSVYNGVLNIGIRPTFGDVIEPLLEAHIFELNKDIYDEIVKVYFVERIRDEKKFQDAEELKLQITKDIETAKKIFNKSASDVSGAAL